ncbi:hypothetical protein D8674_022692 [Pyrus ussuriensis x Pyrus communis]|uniref:Uncharacterized protein n=1 Tax=Pyrus ussuriensis x Pyrus communis TaxID=2448454 RepID=A0A5N5GZB1_9ROSA|nr:hypothetical protein D8674_022692 [Pyrus ussuriensis x Pyrus communis]
MSRRMKVMVESDIGMSRGEALPFDSELGDKLEMCTGKADMSEIEKTAEEVSSDAEGGGQDIARPPFAQLIPYIPSQLKNSFSSQGNLIAFSISNYEADDTSSKYCYDYGVTVEFW